MFLRYVCAANGILYLSLMLIKILASFTTKIRRLDEALAPVQQLADQGHSLLMAGDINIDQLTANDQGGRHDIIKLNIILTKYKDIGSLKQLNFKLTRHQKGCPPSLSFIRRERQT